MIEIGDIDKLEKVIDALTDHYPYDRRVDSFRKSLKQVKVKLDRLYGNVVSFMEKENIIDEL